MCFHIVILPCLYCFYFFCVHESIRQKAEKKCFQAVDEITRRIIINEKSSKTDCIFGIEYVLKHAKKLVLRM